MTLARQAGWRVCLGTRRAGVPPPSWLPEAQAVRFDLLDLSSFEAALNGVDAVVHLAAVNEVESLSDPARALRVNTAGTADLLGACIARGIERFIYFSTAHVYGAPLAGHITEATHPRPVHPYAATHWAAEEGVLAAQAKSRLTGMVFRLSNGFGVPTHKDVDRWMLLVNDLCRQAVVDRKLVLRSSGLQQRDFITLHDVGRAAAHGLGLPRSLSADGLFNIGGECSLSVWAMAQRVRQCCGETLGFEPELIRPEPAAGETAVALNYDIGKFKGTGFLLEGDMDQEIRRTLEMCSGRQQGQKA